MGKCFWIRLLIVVLAVTASRKNFPLMGSSAALAHPDSSVSIIPLTSAAKSEGVIPSRRQHETRRMDWVKSLASHPIITRVAPAKVEASPPMRSQTPIALRQPRYLSVFLNSTAQVSIPPPSSPSPGAGFPVWCREERERT